jgi:Protein similar to CwfJ C-terminus 1
VLDSCYHCYGEDDSPPKAPVIAMATRCYLACPPHEELIEGHCHIVPIQHHLSTLEGDDDLWDEIRVRGISMLEVVDLPTAAIEFYEMLDAYVCRGRQGCGILRDRCQHQMAKAHLYRMCPSSLEHF